MIWGTSLSIGTVFLSAVSTFGWLCEAEFTNSFDYATSGADINLTWDAVAPHYYPLYITAQVIDKDAEGTKATGYKTNITGISTHTSSSLGRLSSDSDGLTTRREVICSRLNGKYVSMGRNSFPSALDPRRVIPGRASNHHMEQR